MHMHYLFNTSTTFHKIEIKIYPPGTIFVIKIFIEVRTEYRYERIGLSPFLQWGVSTLRIVGLASI